MTSVTVLFFLCYNFYMFMFELAYICNLCTCIKLNALHKYTVLVTLSSCDTKQLKTKSFQIWQWHCRQRNHVVDEHALLQALLECTLSIWHKSVHKFRLPACRTFWFCSIGCWFYQFFHKWWPESLVKPFTTRTAKLHTKSVSIQRQQANSLN